MECICLFRNPGQNHNALGIELCLHKAISPHFLLKQSIMAYIRTILRTGKCRRLIPEIKQCQDLPVDKLLHKIVLINFDPGAYCYKFRLEYARRMHCVQLL